MDSSYSKVKSRITSIRNAFLLGLGLLLMSQTSLSAQITAAVFSSPSTHKEPVVSVHFKHEPLAKVLQTLARKVNVGISYETEIVPPKRVTYRASKESIFKILDDVLKDTGLYSTLSQDRKVIMIKKKPLIPAIRQETITGTVTDAGTGNTLPGVNIRVKGTSTGTSTGSDGQYQLTVESLQDTLVFTFVGYQSRTVPINGRTSIDVGLSTSTKALSEMVVVGFGEQQETDVTGSIESIDSNDISSSSAANLSESLQGKVSGAQITSASGKLGQPASIKIRGRASITAGTDPLYVVDGMPVVTQGSNPLKYLNPDNIKSLSILKDASAAAIYGARASNGVVLIETKQGQEGKTQYNVSYNMGYSEATSRRKYPSGKEYINYFNRAAVNGAKYAYNRKGNPAGYPSEQAAINDYSKQIHDNFTRMSQGRDWRTEPFNTDWASMAYQTGSIKKFNMSASGGDKNTTFFAAGSFNNGAGILYKNNLDQYNARFNLHQKADKLSLDLKFNLNRSILERAPNDGSFVGRLIMEFYSPLVPLYQDADSDPTNGYQKGTELVTKNIYPNAYTIASNSSNTRKSFHTIGSAKADYKFMSNLIWTNQIGVDLTTQRENIHRNNKTEFYSGFPGTTSAVWSEGQHYSLNTYLTYNTIIQDNEFNIVGGASYDFNIFNSAGVDGNTFPSGDFQNIENAANISSGSTLENEYGFLSFFTRVNYSYLEKYLVNASIRTDGSSRFGRNNRFGIFPALSLGWIISNENFLNDSDLFSLLKLRASYGITGNSEIDNYASLGLYNGISYAGNPGLGPEQLVNPNLKWEKTKQLDIGVDFGFFNGRISGKLDYYHKKTSNLLLNVNIPSQSGYTSQFSNVGSLKSKGFDISITSNNISSKDFSWSTKFNFSRNRNEVMNINGQVLNSSYISYAIEGYPVGVFYALEYAGVNPKNGDALYWTNDYDKEKGIGIKDHSMGKTNDPNKAYRVKVGSPFPDFYSGITNEFFWKGFNLNFLWYFNYGNKIYNSAGPNGVNSAINLVAPPRGQLKTWEEPGDKTDIPEPRWQWGNGSNAPSSRWLHDGSYIRLKSLTLAYNFPNEFLKRLDMRRLKIFVSGSNLLTFSDYPEGDPELNTDYTSGGNGLFTIGTDFESAPQPRVVIFGINLGF